MVSIPKIVGVMSCGFVLCVGLSYAAHPSAETGPTTGRGSQAGGMGSQEKLKGEEVKTGQTARKSGQGGGKSEETKPNTDEMNAEQSSDKRNDKGQEAMGDKKGGH